MCYFGVLGFGIENAKLRGLPHSVCRLLQTPRNQQKPATPATPPIYIGHSEKTQRNNTSKDTSNQPKVELWYWVWKVARAGAAMIQIHVDKIAHMQTYGFHNNMHHILSTVHALLVGAADHDGTMTMVKSSSVWIMLRFFCECGFLQASEPELQQIKQSVLQSLGSHRRSPTRGGVVGDTLCGSLIIETMHQVTADALCAAMFSTDPSLVDICTNRGPLSPPRPEMLWAAQVLPPALQGPPGGGQSSLSSPSPSPRQRCVQLGEVFRLSVVLEESLKKRDLMPMAGLAVIVRDVVSAALTASSQQGEHQAAWCSAFDDATKKASQQVEFSNQMCKVMIDTIVDGIMCMDTPGRANYVYSLLCVKLLDLYGGQYMQWGGPAALLHGRQSQRGKQHKKSGVEQHVAYRIIEKQALMAKTIRHHGRCMVAEQVLKMVTNVSGFVSTSMPEMMYSAEHGVKSQVRASLVVACPWTTVAAVTAGVLRYEAAERGVHLLRNNDDVHTRFYAPPCAPAHLQATRIGRYDFIEKNGHDMQMLGRCDQILPGIPATATDFGDQQHTMLQVQNSVKIPINLWYILKTVQTFLSDNLQPDDARFQLVCALRQSIVVACLHAMYS